MIERMKKVSLVCQEGAKSSFIEELSRYSFFHPASKGAESEDASALNDRIHAYEKALAALLDLGKLKGHSRQITPTESPKQALTKVQDLLSQRSASLIHIEDLRQEIARISEWSTFEPADIEYLALSGVNLFFYKIKKGVFKKKVRSSSVNFFLLGSAKDFVYISALSSLEVAGIPASPSVVPFRIPVRSSFELEDELKKEQEHETRLLAELKDSQKYIPLFTSEQEELSQTLQCELLYNSIETEELFSAVTGFVPSQKLGEIKKIASKNCWALSASEPVIEDDVPTLQTNSRFTTLLRPVLTFLDITPSYWEKDINFWFLFYLIIFVAMIVTDAAYGIIYVLLAGIFHIAYARKGKKAPLFLKLMYIFGIATAAWGVVTGTWFGSSTLDSLPFFKRMTIPQLASFPDLFPSVTTASTQAILIELSFVVGIFQLSTAHIYSFLKLFPRPKCLSSLGSFSLGLGLFLLICNLVLSKNFPTVYIGSLVGVGIGLIILFSEQEPGRKFLMGIAVALSHLFNIFLDTLGFFSDIISYIRLFAVGLAGVAVMMSFNSMAQSIYGSSHSPLMLVFAILILTAGHAMNMILGVLAVIVHGIRLNILEFSTHADVTWSGTEFEPFRAKTSNWKLLNSGKEIE